MAPTPQPPPCDAIPAPTQQIRTGVNHHWYPIPNNPPYAWADRTPSAEIRLGNGNDNDNDRGLKDYWWDATLEGPPWTCSDTYVDTRSSFDVESNTFSGSANGRPDQIDWLIAQLQDRYDRGYRRIVLFLPAGNVRCQDFAQSHWWPMAQWRRDWFTAEIMPTPAFDPPEQKGVRGWIKDHPDVKMGVYLGWPIGNPCSICLVTNWNLILGNCTVEQHNCGNGDLTGLWHFCPLGTTSHQPSTMSQDDMKVVWQNIQPWRQIGITRFWFDGSSGKASDNETEFLEFVNNPNFPEDEFPSPTLGGEAFPLVNTTSLPPELRYTVNWSRFDYAPFVCSLVFAENQQHNGNPCPGWHPQPCVGAPPVSGAHTWQLGITPVREGAIFPTEWPKCADGSIHPDWDCAWKRLTNLYDWYICRGFTFRQGDLNGAQSGAAERFFGFGKIVPPGDFDGDGERTLADWDAYQSQYAKWRVGDPFANPPIPPGTSRHCYNPNTHQLTYFHGDMNSDGEVNESDQVLALQVIFLGMWILPEYWLGEGGPSGQGSHKMLWNPNVKWLPCELCGEGGGGSASSFGPP